MLPELAPGVVLAGRYRLDHELGRGGVGVVWAALDQGARRVALKILSDRALSDGTIRRRFVREARALVELRHPAVVGVYEVFELDGGTPVIAMEALRGENLRRRLERSRALALPVAAAVLSQVARVVAFAHERGIVHRDLKPENIFLCEGAPRGAEVKVLDFGIAKLLAPSPSGTSVVTEMGVGLGTVHYAAPEQILNAAEVDRRADVWSLGVIVYECLAGFRPIEGTNDRDLLRRVLSDAIPPLSAVSPDVPRGISGLVERMLARSVDDRLADVAEVGRTLAEYAEPSGS